MASAPGDDELFENFLAQRGHDTSDTTWQENYNKKQCPECGGVHESSATECRVCGWSPYQ